MFGLDDRARPSVPGPACSVDESNLDNRPSNQRFSTLPFAHFFASRRFFASIRIVAFSARGLGSCVFQQNRRNKWPQIFDLQFVDRVRWHGYRYEHDARAERINCRTIYRTCRQEKWTKIEYRGFLLITRLLITRFQSNYSRLKCDFYSAAVTKSVYGTVTSSPL